MKKIVGLLVVLSSTSLIYGAGFGIYEASARGNAMGGAIVGDVHDATASYHNPANLANITNISVSTGVTFINPYCDIEVDHHDRGKMNAGWFTVPNFYLSIPIIDGLTFGWGNYTEYGLGSKYKYNWDLAADTRKSEMVQLTFNPNLAYKITDWWSVAAGLRVSYLKFKTENQPGYGFAGMLPGLPEAHPGPYNLHAKLNGDDIAIGWMAATSFKPHEDWDIGLVYRSPIKHKIKGKFDLNGDILGMIPVHAHTSGANAKLTLPESLTLGVNYRATDKFRMGGAVTYKRWSSIKDIYFNIPGYAYMQKLRWHDVVRVGFGFEYDFNEWLTGRCGYTFDRDPSNSAHQSTLLPPGDRHIIGMGVGFKLTENLTLDFGYNFIRMNNDHYTLHMKDGPEGSVPMQDRYVSQNNGYAHLASASLTYTF